MASTMVTPGEMHDLDQDHRSLCERLDALQDNYSADTAPDPPAAACTAVPAQYTQEAAEVMASLLRTAASAAIAANAIPPLEEPDADESEEEFDTPYSMSRAELRSMRDTLGMGLARMALFSRTPATDVQVRCAIAYLRCHDAPAQAVAGMRLPQLVAQLRHHPMPAIANQSRALLADRDGCFREAIRVVRQISPTEVWLFNDTLSDGEDSGARSGLKLQRAKKGVKAGAAPSPSSYKRVVKGRSMAAAPQAPQAPVRQSQGTALAQADDDDDLSLLELAQLLHAPAAARQPPQQQRALAPAPAPEPDPPEPPPPPYKSVAAPQSAQPTTAPMPAVAVVASEEPDLTRAPAPPTDDLPPGGAVPPQPGPPPRGRAAQSQGEGRVPKRARTYSPASERRYTRRQLSRFSAGASGGAGATAAAVDMMVLEAKPGAPDSAHHHQQQLQQRHLPLGSSSGPVAFAESAGASSGVGGATDEAAQECAPRGTEAKQPSHARSRACTPPQPMAGAGQQGHGASSTLPPAMQQWVGLVLESNTDEAVQERALRGRKEPKRSHGRTARASALALEAAGDEQHGQATGSMPQQPAVQQLLVGDAAEETSSPSEGLVSVVGESLPFPGEGHYYGEGRHHQQQQQEQERSDSPGVSPAQDILEEIVQATSPLRPGAGRLLASDVDLLAHAHLVPPAARRSRPRSAPKDLSPQASPPASSGWKQWVALQRRAHSLTDLDQTVAWSERDF